MSAGTSWTPSVQRDRLRVSGHGDSSPHTLHPSVPQSHQSGSGQPQEHCARCPMSPCPLPACRALVDELEWEIAQVDPRKTIQMGSFRINPDGSQSVVEVRPVPVSRLPGPLPGPALSPARAAGAVRSLRGAPDGAAGARVREDEGVRGEGGPGHAPQELRPRHLPRRHQDGPFRGQIRRGRHLQPEIRGV